MVRDIRIKSYIFAPSGVNANNVGSATSIFTDHVLNGELLRVDSFSNYTGSLILRQSGLTSAFTNFTATSGTSKWESFSLSNTTGSFVTNSVLQLIISGLASGTSTLFGPIEVLYR